MSGSRPARWHRDRVEQARTAEDQFAAAVDWTRAAVGRLPRTERGPLLTEAARAVAGIAAEAERRHDGSAE